MPDVMPLETHSSQSDSHEMVGGASTESRPGIFRVLIRPNQALTPQAMVAVVTGFAIVSLTIGAAFATQGFWLVLPFAGLEVVLFGGAFWFVAQAAKDYDLLSVGQDDVTLYQCHMGEEKEYRFQRAWTRVRLREGTRFWESPVLSVGSHGKNIEIGRALTADRRRSLAAEIRPMLDSFVNPPE